ncbi:MAG: undecaprenyldiphospho-muramoylpentapeptide beta-N-acetylglucosaminyltransferase [Bacteroidetes bacterium 47-18]|nr:MAG: undecaprenyldiphospho-muramoylpentapeptide beta-N-acetylglucosaminyltransferase [Bacteroidetes bacterium 47-18]
MNIIIAGGGTGGHIFPAVAIAHALKAADPAVNILFVGANGKMEMEKVPKEGYRIIGLDIAGFNRSNLLKNLSLPFKLWKSNKAAMNIIREFKPDAVVGVGGFASFPVLNAAQKKGIPTLIQEQNSFAGKTNKILGKKAAAVCVAYDNMQRFFPAEKIVMTGNPVRKAISQSKVSREDAARSFGLDAARKTILVVGGSLGAKSINQAMAGCIPALVAQDIQVVWQTGKTFISEAAAIAAQYPQHVKAMEFIYEMDQAYAVCDMIISRAGALAIAEICIVARPAIFIPYPFAAEDHQTSNAQALVDKQAAWMIPDDRVRELLQDKVQALIHDEKQLQQMHDNLLGLAIKDADVRIAAQIRNIIQSERK